MFERILVPIDFGAVEDDVVRVARKLSARGAQVRLLHVVSDETTTFVGDKANYTRFVDWARSRIGVLSERYSSDASFQPVALLREGNIYRQVVEACKQFEPDVIVMGSHNRHGFERLLLGSVAEKVLRGIDSPVCIVKTSVSELATLDNIALATDFESSSDAATRVFRDLIDGAQALGTVLHGLQDAPWHSELRSDEPPQLVEPEAATVREQLQAWQDGRRKQRQAQLRELMGKIHEDGRCLSAELLEGEPWTTIAEFTKTHGTELLVLGTHRYAGLQRFMLGSVAEKILRTVECPVLVVPNKS